MPVQSDVDKYTYGKHSVLNVQFPVGMIYTAFPFLVLMYMWTVSFYVSLLQNKQLYQGSENMFLQ